jgi:nucleoid DNA-binding protein
MKVYFLDAGAGLCAKYHSDKDIERALSDVNQLIANALHRRIELKGNKAGFTEKDIPIDRDHYIHFMSKWARESKGNFEWICRFGGALIREYFIRRSERPSGSDDFAAMMPLHKLVLRGLKPAAAVITPEQVKNARKDYKATKRTWAYCENPLWYDGIDPKSLKTVKTAEKAMAKFTVTKQVKGGKYSKMPDEDPPEEVVVVEKKKPVVLAKKKIILRRK